MATVSVTRGTAVGEARQETAFGHPTPSTPTLCLEILPNSKDTDAGSSELTSLKTGDDVQERSEEETEEQPVEEDYDTDLEPEEEHMVYDHTGKTTYVELCRRHGVIPTSYYLRHMGDTKLDLRHHGLGASGIRPICSSLAGNTSVLQLDLTDNWLDYEGGLCLCEMMRENCFISNLNLSDNHLGADIAEQLAEVLGSNSQLTHLSLSGNEFCDKAAVHLALLLASSPRLIQFDLSHNDFGEQAGVMFGRAIGENSVMVELDLSWNHIRARGAKSIANGLAINTALKKLNLGWNGLGPVLGAAEMGKALKANTCLEELDLSNNRIVAEGAVLLGKGLSANTSLRVLKMGKNPMQTAGCYALLSAISKGAEGTRMESLVLQDVLVNEDFRELEKATLETLPGLRVEIGPALTVRKKAAIHPMIKLRRYIERHKIRLIDFFNNIDTDRSMSVTREEFIEGMARLIKETGLRFSDEEMQILMDVLDKDGDGEINYSELVISNSQFTDMEKKHAAGISTINVH